MISIVTPAFNRAHTLPRTYGSLKEQGQGFEWIVVDDASTDDTASLVEDWASSDPRIHLIKLKENVGVNSARMAGVRLSTAPFIFFLDSDDELTSTAIQTLEQVSNSLQGSIGVAVLPTSSFNDEDGLADFGFNEGQILGEYEIVCGRALEKELSYLYRRDVFDFQGLPEDMRACEFLFVYGLSRRYLFVASNKKVLNINRQTDNLSSSRGVAARSGEIGLGYLRLVHQHDQILKDCHSMRSRYLLKSAMRSKMAGNNIKGVMNEARDLRADRKVIIHFLSFIPGGLMLKLDELRVSLMNKRLFGKD